MQTIYTILTTIVPTGVLMYVLITPLQEEYNQNIPFSQWGPVLALCLGVFVLLSFLQIYVWRRFIKKIK